MSQTKKIKLQPPPKGQFTTMRDYEEGNAKQLLTNLIPHVQGICGRNVYSPHETAHGIAQLRHILRIFKLGDTDLIETIDGYLINRPDKDKIQAISGLSVLHTIATHLDVKYQPHQCISTGKRMDQTSENIKKALLSHYDDQRPLPTQKRESDFCKTEADTQLRHQLLKEMATITDAEMSYEHTTSI